MLFVIAKLHDEADVRRAYIDRIFRRPGIDLGNSGEGSVAVERALHRSRRHFAVDDDLAQRRIADGRADRNVLREYEARKLICVDRAGNIRQCRRVAPGQVPLGRKRDVARRQIGKPKAVVGVLIGRAFEKIRVAAGHFVEPRRRGPSCPSDVRGRRKQLRVLVLQYAVFETAIDIVRQGRQVRRNGRDRIRCRRNNSLGDIVVQRQNQALRRHCRQELGFCQVRIIGHDIDIDRRIRAAPDRICQRGKRVLAIGQVKHAARSDHDRLDIAHEIGFERSARRKEIEGGGLGVDLRETFVHLGRHQ